MRVASRLPSLLLSSFRPCFTRPHQTLSLSKNMEPSSRGRSADLDPLASVSVEDVPQVETMVVNVDPTRSTDEDYRRLLKFPVELIQRGECVAFPTETVYGLGANALDGKAARKVCSCLALLLSHSLPDFPHEASTGRQPPDSPRLR